MLQQGPWCVSHFLLADKYRTISIKIPSKLDNKPEVETSHHEKVKYWVLLSLNIIAPVLMGVAAITLRTTVFIKEEKPSTFLSIFNAVAYDTAGALQTYSGVVLVRSVLSIRNFFRDKGKEDFINTGMLVRHALAFGLYLFITIIFFLAFTVYAFFPDSPKIFTIFNLTAIGFYFGSLIAQVLLCRIFWDLGKKVEARADSLNSRESIRESKVTRASELTV